MVNWDQWDAWKNLWNDWTRLRAEKDLAVSHIQFLDLFNFFVRQIKALGIDPSTVDVRAYLDPALTYQENKKILAEIMQVPPTSDEYESMYESYKQELTDQVKEKYPEVVAEFEKRIRQLEKETERLPRVERQRVKFKKLAESLRFDLEETERRREEEKRALEQKVAPVNLRFLKPFTEGIIDYKAGSIISTRNIDWTLDLIQKGLAERVSTDAPVEVRIPPRALTTEEKKQLEDEFKAHLMKELGRVPPNVMAEFRVALRKVEMSPFEEALKEILEQAQEISVRQTLRRRPPVPAVARAPRIRRGIEEEGERITIGRVVPTYPPREPLEPEAMKFPRSPSSREELVFWNAFKYRLQEQGFNPFEYQDQFQEYIAKSQFHSWKDLLKKYEFFVETIKTGKALPPLWQWKGTPIPVGLEGVLRKTPAERLQDVIVHFTSVVIRNARQKGEEPTLNDLKKELEERALIEPGMILTPGTPLYEEMKTALMDAYERKDAWLTGITLEELSSFLET